MKIQYKNVRSLLAWFGLSVAYVLLAGCAGPATILIPEDLNPKNQNTYHPPSAYTGDFSMKIEGPFSVKFTSQDNYAIIGITGCYAGGQIGIASVTTKGLDAVCSLASNITGLTSIYYLYPRVIKQPLILNDSPLTIAVLDANKAVMTTIAPSTTPVTLPVGAKYLRHSAPAPIQVEWQDDYYMAKKRFLDYSKETLYEIPDADSWRVIKINAHVIVSVDVENERILWNIDRFVPVLASSIYTYEFTLSKASNYYAKDVIAPSVLINNLFVPPILPEGETFVHCADPLPQRETCRLQFDAAGIAEMTRQDPTLMNEQRFFQVYVRNYP